MYADHVEAQASRSVKDRLDGNSSAGPGRRRPISGKRQREDDKWEHDLFEDGERQVSSQRVGVKDLRLKLRRRNTEQSVRGYARGGARDLLEKLSGALYAHAVESKTPAVRPKPAPETTRKPSRMSVIAQTNAPETKVASSVSKKKVQQKVDSVESFLHSLGLEKYLITFQAEEVDTAALVHMSDEDLKAMGIPMGPRKKILLALELKKDD